MEKAIATEEEAAAIALALHDSLLSPDAETATAIAMAVKEFLKEHPGGRLPQSRTVGRLTFARVESPWNSRIFALRRRPGK